MEIIEVITNLNILYRTVNHDLTNKDNVSYDKIKFVFYSFIINFISFQRTIRDLS